MFCTALASCQFYNSVIESGRTKSVLLILQPNQEAI